MLNILYFIFAVWGDNMKTKVMTCGKYECSHCSSAGQCMLNSISIDKDGKCTLYIKSPAKKIPIYNPADEHTNMC
jgi:hypothetical protein